MGKELINYALESGDQRFLPEIDEKTKMQIHKPKICESLNGIDWIVLVRCLTFNNNTTFDEQINPQRVTDDNTLVDYRNMNLFFNFQTSLRQFVRKCILIHRLKQSWATKRSMNGYGRI